MPAETAIGKVSVAMALGAQGKSWEASASADGRRAGDLADDLRRHTTSVDALGLFLLYSLPL